jgi:hypothetical protein
MNLLNPDFIFSYLSSYAKYYNSKNIKEDNPVIVWAKKFNSNFNKLLTTNTIEEKITRSFIYGTPNQYTYSIADNKFVTYINRNIYPVMFSEPYYKNQPSETLTNLSNELTYYLFYTESGVENKDNLLSYMNVKILCTIDIRWLIPAAPLLMNPLCTPDIISTIGKDNSSHISYTSSSAVERFKREMINSWDSNMLVWDSHETPILQYFYKRMYKSIGKYLKK